jgi:hypothetical protein
MAFWISLLQAEAMSCSSLVPTMNSWLWSKKTALVLNPERLTEKSSNIDRHPII